MSELPYKEEAASAYDHAFAHVSTHFLPFLLRAARLEVLRSTPQAVRKDGCSLGRSIAPAAKSSAFLQ